MGQILNHTTVKSLFKAPRGQKAPPPPPPINSIFRGFIIFVLLLIGLAPNVAAQDATVSIITGVGSGSNKFVFEGSSALALSKSIRLSAAQSQSVPFRVCFSSSFITPNFQVARAGISITLTNSCYDDSVVAIVASRANKNSSAFYILRTTDNTTDEPDEIVTLTFRDDPDNARPSGVAEINLSTTVTVRDDDPTIVTLSRTGSGTVDEGGTVEFTVTLGRELIAGEIIDVPLIVSGTNITTADWSLAAKTGDALNTGITLISETTAAPVVRFSDAAADTATLILSAVADNTPEGGPETLILALGPNNANANGFDLESRMTNMGGGADPDGTDNTFNVTIDDDMTAPMPSAQSLDAITEQCSLRREDLPVPTATDNQMGTVMVTNNITNFPITSTTTITWTYTDASNNTATQTQEVIIRDTMNPVPSRDNDLSTLTAACSIPAADVTIPTAMDNCDGRIMATANITPPITASTTITWTYTDAAGNTATQTQEVVINDNMPPTPNPSNDLSEITRQCPLEENELTTPAATDNCTGSVTVTNDVTSFPIMESRMITWTYSDAAGNAVTQTQEVVVNSDVLIPDVPSLPVLTEQCRIAALSSPTAKNCSANTITATTTANLPITTNSTITWTYTDGGNSTTQTQEVTIMDTMDPVPDNTLSALTAAGSLAQAEVTVPTATDSCDGQLMAVPDVTFPITSDVTITWTYTDAAGNMAAQTQQVTITEAPLNVAEDAAEAVIFPNPSGRYLEVRSSMGGTFRILSLSGKPLLEGTTNTRVDISSLRSGLYLVQLSDGHLLKFVRE